MKFALTLLASLVSADCDWIWEDCSSAWYRYNCDGENGDTDCGWWYWDEWNYDEYWVTCDDFACWEGCNGGVSCDVAVCDNEWIWEECSWMYYRDPCEGEGDTECGWVYWDDWWQEEFWVDCDEFWSWDWCW